MNSFNSLSKIAGFLIRAGKIIKEEKEKEKDELTEQAMLLLSDAGEKITRKRLEKMAELLKNAPPNKFPRVVNSGTNVKWGLAKKRARLHPQPISNAFDGCIWLVWLDEPGQVVI